MSLETLEPFLKPSSIALLGASSRPGSVGAILARNLLAYGRERLAFVNPVAGEVEGIATVPRLADIGWLP
jgi:acetyltransferase